MNTPLRSQLISQLWKGRDPFSDFPGNLYADDSQGWNSHHPYLTDFGYRTEPFLIVEVGVWKGGSALTMAGHLKNLGMNGAVIAVDTWLGAWDHWIKEEWFDHLFMQQGYPGLQKIFMGNVLKQGLEHMVVPLPLDSLNASLVLSHRGIQADLIHIDAAHDYDSVRADLKAWWPLVRPGGVLVGDDYHAEIAWPGVKRAFDEFVSDYGLESQFEHEFGKCRIRRSLEVDNALSTPLNNTVRDNL